MDQNEFIDRLLAMREVMYEERAEQEQELLELRAREEELTALLEVKNGEINVQEETIKQKQKVNDDQNEMLEQLIKVRDDLEKEMGIVRKKRSHGDKDNDSTSEKKPKTEVAKEDDQEGTSSTAVPDKVSDLSTVATLREVQPEDVELEQNNSN